MATEFWDVMTLDNLRDLVEGACWFTRLGQCAETPERLPLRSLEPPEEDEAWDWLPTSVHEDDPISAESLKLVAEQLGKGDERHRALVDFQRLTLRSLRGHEHPLLRVGPTNYTEAARGGALFAVRMAVGEIMAGREGFWCSIIPLYAAGYWPLGLHDDGRLVVL